MITDFLKTRQSPHDLKAALEIVREFKLCESREEWLSISFLAWDKLEQLEEFLAHLVEGKPLKEDTLAYIEADERGKE
jgi:hypothetical protein